MHPVRRLERELIDEYSEAIRSALPVLGPDTLGTATKMADLPDQVRGYEQIKLDNVTSYRRDLATVRKELAGLADLRSRPIPS